MITEPITPELTQVLDKSRPHRLVSTSNPRRSAQLVYEYTDNGQCVSVPNVSYNQSAYVHASLTRLAIIEIEAKIDSTKRDIRLSPAAKADIVRRYMERVSELTSLLSDQEIAAQNEGMGIYSCGLPPADNVGLPRTRAAVAHYLAKVKPGIEAAFERMFSGDDFYGAFKEWEDGLIGCADDLRLAFYLDTSNINSRDSCNRMDVDRIVELARRASHAPAEAAPA